MSRALDDLSPRFRPLADRLLARLTEARILVLITSTGRTAAEQAIAVATGHSQVTHSKHQDGDALDVVPYQQYLLHGDDKISYDRAEPVWFQIGAIGEALGLRWGGRFTPLDAHGLGWDPGHFEYPTQAGTPTLHV